MFNNYLSQVLLRFSLKTALVRLFGRVLYSFHFVRN